jgi:hypothetical protein
MEWKLPRFIVWSVNAEAIAQSWLPGWSGVGGDLWPFTRPARPVVRVDQQTDGWRDVFLGQVTPHDSQRRCILDSHTRVGVHYRLDDPTIDWTQAAPSPEIPQYLWATLQGLMVESQLSHRSYLPFARETLER